jgi:cobalt-zinc-cadmium efflux system outer membrane protein
LQLTSNKQQDFYKEYKDLYNHIATSYQQRQIGLIEFIDYFDAYKDIRQKQLQQELNLQLAKEELNLQVGTEILP